MAPPVTPSPHRFMVKKDEPNSAPAGSQFVHTPRYRFTTNYSNKTIKETPKFVLNPSNFEKSSGKKPIQNQIPKFILNPLESEKSPGKKPIQPQNPKFFLKQSEFEKSIGKILFQGDKIDTESEDASDLGKNLNEDSCIEIRPKDERKYGICDEPASKRRRRTLSPALLDKSVALENEAKKLIDESNDMLLPSPVTPAPSLSKSKLVDHIRTPRFLISSPDPMFNSSVMKEKLIFAKPPVFRPPDTYTQSDIFSDPNPEQFSPHRRGDKYVTGGLAAELRNWLVNIKSSIPTSQINGKDQWLLKIMVENFIEGSRAGMILVSGRKLKTLGAENKDFAGDAKVILASEITSLGHQRNTDIVKGKIIGIKGPIWEVTIKNEKWAVGVDWKLI